MAFLFGKNLSQPQTHIAGDTLIFSEDLAAYPSSDGWTAEWYLLGTNTYHYPAVADGSGFKWTIATNVTAIWPAGQYKSFIRVSKAGEVHTVNELMVMIKANVATIANGYDPRSNLRVMYDSIVEAVKKLSSKEVTTYSVGTPTGSQRTVTYADLPTLIGSMNRLKRQVNEEDRVLGIRSGIRSGKIVTSMDAAR